MFKKITNNKPENLTSELMQQEEKKLKTSQRAVLVKSLLCIAGAVGLGVMLPAIVLANAKFDLDAGAVAGTAPFVALLKAHWSKAVLLVAGGCALFGEGDQRQRAKIAGIGAGAAGAVILALLAGLS
jgi:hypothetical protein